MLLQTLPALRSNHRGVIWHAGAQRWRSAIKHRGKKIFLGHYVNEEEAAMAFDRAALQLRVGVAGCAAAGAFSAVCDVAGRG